MSTDLNDVPYQLNYEEAVEICYFKGGKLFEPSNENILQPVSKVNEDYWSYVTLQIKRRITSQFSKLALIAVFYLLSGHEPEYG